MEIDSYLEEFRLNDEELIDFYKKFSLQQLKNLRIIIVNVEKYSIKTELNILDKYIENVKNNFQYNEDEAFYDKLDDYNQDKPLTNILKQKENLNNQEIKFLYVINDDANNNFKHIIEYYDYELGEKEKQYSSYVDETNKIKSVLYNKIIDNIIHNSNGLKIKTKKSK